MSAVFIVLPSHPDVANDEAELTLDHIVHHLLSLYAIGASPDQIQNAFKLNTRYQRPAKSPSNPVWMSLSDHKVFRQHLGKPEFYQEYLKFFQNAIQEHGVETTCNEFLFKGSEGANDMLGRLFSGIFSLALYRRRQP
jgi:oxidoreductase AflY